MPTVIVVGPSGAGKSAICKRLVENEFNDFYSKTQGASFHVKPYDAAEVGTTEFLFWDIENNKEMINVFLKDADIVLCVFAHDVPGSLAALKKQFLEDPAFNPPNNLHKPCYILVGTKLDNGVTQDAGAIEQICQKYQMKSFSVSAKTGVGMNSLWNYLKDKVCELFKLKSNQRHALRKGGLIPKQKQLDDKKQLAKDECSHLWDDNLLLLLNIRNVLHDYAQDNNRWRLWTSIHANRHHTRDVALIVNAIDNKRFTSEQEIIDVLIAIPNKNPSGALSRRIDFICDKLSMGPSGKIAADLLVAPEEQGSSCCCGLF